MTARLLTPLALAVLSAPVARADEAQRFTDLINVRLAEKWKSAGVEPHHVCDDATFLRRVYLDLTGTIPPASEVRQFLANVAKDKRNHVVEQLLRAPGYVRHFSAVWRGVLLGEDRADADLEDWLRVQFAANLPYDRLVRAVLTQPTEPAQRGEPSPRAFFRGRENKPDELAASATRIFL